MQYIKLDQQNNSILINLLKKKEKGELLFLYLTSQRNSNNFKKIRKRRKHRTRKSISNAVIETGFFN